MRMEIRMLVVMLMQLNVPLHLRRRTRGLRGRFGRLVEARPWRRRRRLRVLLGRRRRR